MNVAQMTAEFLRHGGKIQRVPAGEGGEVVMRTWNSVARAKARKIAASDHTEAWAAVGRARHRTTAGRVWGGKGRVPVDVRMTEGKLV